MTTAERTPEEREMIIRHAYALPKLVTPEIEGEIGRRMLSQSRPGMLVSGAEARISRQPVSTEGAIARYRATCALLSQHPDKTPTEVARLYGIPRTTMNRIVAWRGAQ